MQGERGRVLAPTTNIRGGGDRNLKMDNTVCIPDFEFTSEKGCTTEGITQMVAVLTRRLERRSCPHDALKELKLILGVTTQKEVWEFFYQQCFAFWSTQETQNLKDIGDGTDVFLKAFFDGGTYWNDARQTSATSDGSTINVLSEDPGQKIDEVNNKDAKFGVINLPEEISNFDNCKSNSAMCCWIQDRQAGDDNGNCEEPYDENCVDANPSDNTDVCLVDMKRSRESNRVRSGYAIFGSNVESATHCHGFAWTEDELDPNTIFKGNNLFYVSMFDHLYQRGYVKNVPGAPMCGCTEQMPVVSRADCTQVSVRQDVTFSFAPQLTVVYQDAYEVAFDKCRAPDAPNNDLGAFYTRLVNEDRARVGNLQRLQRTLVGRGNCTNVIDDFVAGLNE